MPKVSVVMPTFNREKFLGEAIDSLRQQTFQDWELVIIDDGSSDGTSELVHELITHEERIRYFYQPNAGEYAATNKGLSLAEGEYLTFLHSDDILPVHSLERRVAALDSNPMIGLVHGDLTKLDEEGNVTERLVATADTSAQVLQHYCLSEAERTHEHYFVHFPTFMFRRSLLPKIGNFDETLTFAGDLDWMLKAVAACDILYVPADCYAYRRHDASISRQEKRAGVDIQAITEAVLQRHCHKA